MHSLWKDNEGIVEWNFRAQEEQDKKIRRRRIIMEQEALLRKGISGKAFAKNYARRWHPICFAVVDNQKSCYENTQKELKEE